VNRSWDVTLRLPAAMPLVFPAAPLPSGNIVPCIIAHRQKFGTGHPKAPFVPSRSRDAWKAALAAGKSRGLRLVEVNVGAPPHAVTWWVAGAVIYGGETYRQIIAEVVGRGRAPDASKAALLSARGELVIHDARQDGFAPLLPVLSLAAEPAEPEEIPAPVSALSPQPPAVPHRGEPHRCPEGCDECNDHDCKRRRRGVMPACPCQCHVRCFVAAHP